MTTRQTTTLTIIITALAVLVLYFYLVKTDPLTPTPSPTLSPTASPTASPKVTPYTSDKVIIDSPLPGSIIKSPLKITGKARGIWYFEASFPVRLLDANGKEITVKPAQATSDWMTTDFVPFEVTLTFTAPITNGGTLVFEKDNPSDMRQYDDSVSFPVLFR